MEQLTKKYNDVPTFFSRHPERFIVTSSSNDLDIDNPIGVFLRPSFPIFNNDCEAEFLKYINGV